MFVYLVIVVVAVVVVVVVAAGVVVVVVVTLVIILTDAIILLSITAILTILPKMMFASLGWAGIVNFKSNAPNTSTSLHQAKVILKFTSYFPMDAAP